MRQPDKETAAIWENLKDCYQNPGVDYILPAGMQTLPDLFSARVIRTPDKLAYSENIIGSGLSLCVKSLPD